jgi:DNA repair exonuclease SbcCD ATPase subunit
MQTRLGVAKDFMDTLGQQAVQNYQNRSENQAKIDEGNSLLKRLETEKATRLRNEGNLATLNSDIEKTNSYITTTEAENKKIELNPNKTQEDITKYGENQANLAIAKASLDPHKGSLYKKWNDVNLQGRNQADEDKIAEIKRYLSRIGKGTYKQGGSLSLEEKKDLESYKSNLKENRDAKRDKVKDLRESLKESKKLAQELYKSSKENRKEGTKLIMDFYKSIKK